MGVAHTVSEENNNTFRTFYMGPFFEEDPSREEQQYRAPLSCLQNLAKRTTEEQLFQGLSICCLFSFNEICSDANVHLSSFWSLPTLSKTTCTLNFTAVFIILLLGR